MDFETACKILLILFKVRDAEESEKHPDHAFLADIRLALADLALIT